MYTNTHTHMHTCTSEHTPHLVFQSGSVCVCVCVVFRYKKKENGGEPTRLIVIHEWLGAGVNVFKLFCTRKHQQIARPRTHTQIFAQDFATTRTPFCIDFSAMRALR